jgi:hypothetical protein
MWPFNTMRSASADKSQTPVILFGLFFISFEFVCRPDSGRPEFALGYAKIIVGMNLREIHAAHWMFFFM